MMKHFNKLGAPLYSIHEYPSLKQQEQRFKNAGWAQARARSLWNLWSDDQFLSSSTRDSLNKVESFDEWEEFALFASHYFLLHASTRKLAADGNGSEVTHETGSHTSTSAQYVLLPPCPPGGDQRRYGAMIPDISNKSLGHHGGIGRQTRLASTSLYSQSKDIRKPSHPFPSGDITARMCHTVTILKDSACLLAGGRTSPAGGFRDCWLRQRSQWKPVHSLPEPRYRHSAVKVNPDANSEYVLIYGGKTSVGQALDSWILWSDNGNGWQAIETTDRKPCARFGASLETTNDTTGVVFGGIGEDNTILEDFWTWSLYRKEDGSFCLSFADVTEKLQKASLFKYICRFGATVNRTSRGLVIIGGIIPNQIVPADKEILLLDVTELIQVSDIQSSNIISAIGLGVSFPGPRPLLCGHVCCTVCPDHILILGGGAVCFSFGTFWTEGTWLLKPVESVVENSWALVPESVQSVERPTTLPSASFSPALQKDKDIPKVSKVQVTEPAQFEQILVDGKPVVIEGSDIGPCTDLWTKEYMVDAVGSDRKV